MPGQPSNTCLNCSSALTGAFCSACGQKAGPAVLTTKEILHDLTHELLHWDGKLPSTLRALFTRPGLLTTEMLAGRRARWLPPLRIYLICSLAFFAIKPLFEITTGRSPRQRVQITADIQPGQQLTPEQREAVVNSPFGRIFGAERVERAILNGRDFSREIEGAYPKAMFVLLPVFAVLTGLAWRGRRLPYAAHLVNALHLHAALFGALAMFWMVATVIPSNGVAAVAFVCLGVYGAWYGLNALKHVFESRWGITVLKFIAVAVPYWICVMVTGAVILMLTILAG